MKKIVLFYIFLSISFHLVAQDGIGKNQRQVKASNHSYWVSEVIVEGINFLRHVDVTDSIRLIPYEYPEWAPKPEFSDTKKIKEVIKSRIRTKLKKNNITPAENEYILVIPITDNSGKIKELILNVPERWQIPITVIEDCMTAVKESGFEMYFDRTNRFLKDERILNYAYPFSIWSSQLTEE